MSISKKRYKFFLDTSIIFHKATRSKGFVESQVKEWNDADLYTSYFVIYEFLTGMLKAAIEYYFFIKLFDGDIEDALATWSDHFKIRTLKNTFLIEPIIRRLDKGSPRDSKKAYLAGVETSILFLWKICKIDLKGIIGDFGDHEIFDFEIHSADDFIFLLEVAERNKYIDLSVFWNKNQDKLKLIIEHFERNKASLDTSLKKFFVNLKKIAKNPEEASKHKCSRKSSDAVIAVECTSKMELLSFDNSFSFLCPALSKDHRKLSKPKFPTISHILKELK